ncbi:MAG: hypothetical protein IJT12_01645 [Paludibacteraceae bacterium]|nr:hypothetical protein [Paludibacteraceae bacterium]
MKKIFSLFAAVLFAGSMMAIDFTLTSASSVTKDGVTVTFAKGDGNNDPAWYDNGLRLYASNTVTVASATPITAITFNWEKQGQKAFNTATASTGSYTHPTEPGQGTWTGSATSVTFTLGATGQLQLNTFSVIVGEGGGEGGQGGGEGGQGGQVAADTLTCAQAAEQALAGKTDEVIIKGYVTEMVEEWSTYKNVSFWMADAKGGDNTFEAFRVKCETAAEAPTVGALVWVKGKLTKYTKNDVTIPETSAGGSFGILVKGEEVAPAQNLGAKTIAEFLQLKNKRDTCILTGVVSNIVSTEYGNFDLTDESGTVYVYGLLTAAGESKQFESLDVEEGDTLTLKALYNEYNGAGQVKNGIFVSVKKGEGVEGETISIEITDGVIYTDAVATDGWWQISGENDDYYVSLSNGNEITQAAGTYTVDDLDAEYSFIYDYAADAYVELASGSVKLVIAENGVVTAEGQFVGSDGNTYDLKIVYTEPEAKNTKTLVMTGLFDIEESEIEGVTYSTLTIAGSTEDESTLQLMIADATEAVGEYTEEDLYFNYSGIYDAETDEEAYIYKATIKVEAAGEGLYTLTADLLCYNNVLYKVTMALEEYTDGIESTTVAGKALKAIQNGTVVIEKSNVLYNINGQTIR